MKKFITLALALILALSMTVCTFALDLNDENKEGRIEVTGSYVANDPTGEKLAVVLATTGTAWIYTVDKAWDASNLTYTETGAWSNEAGQTTITVENKSPFAITYQFTAVNVASELASYVDVTVSKGVDAAVELAAVDAGQTTSDSATVTVSAKDGADVIAEEDFATTVATITVTIAKKANLE